MASKTNSNINGHDYYRIRKKVGRKYDEKKGMEVDVIKNFYGKNKSEAVAKYNEFMNRKSMGLSNEKQYFGIMADKYIYTVFLNDSKFSKNTKELYINAWNNYVKGSDVYNMRLDEIQSIEMQKLYNSLACSSSTIKVINNMMKHFYRYLEKVGYCRDLTHSLAIPVKETPAREKKSWTDDKLPNTIEVWSDDELKRIFDNLGSHRLRFLIMLASGTGTRISELLALQYKDISNGMLHINKQLSNKAVIEEGKKTKHVFELADCKTSASVRDIPLSKELMNEFNRHQAWHKSEMLKRGYRTESVFTTSSGAFYDRHNITTACNRFYKKHGIPQRGVHTYRRTFATNLCKQGIPIQVASELLGHSDISVTAKYYVNVGEDEKQSAIEALATSMFQN